MAASKTPITKDVNVNKTGSSSLSGNELKIRGKKANYVVNRDSKELKEIPVNKSKRKYKKGGLNKWFKEKWEKIRKPFKTRLPKMCTCSKSCINDKGTNTFCGCKKTIHPKYWP